MCVCECRVRIFCVHVQVEREGGGGEKMVERNIYESAHGNKKLFSFLFCWFFFSLSVMSFRIQWSHSPGVLFEGLSESGGGGEQDQVMIEKAAEA